MILIGIGSNTPGPWGSAQETVAEAIRRLDEGPLRLVVASGMYRTRPFGVEDQADFINAVAHIETGLEPQALMLALHDIELAADRRRSMRWGPRTLDLDLIDYHGQAGKYPLPGGYHGGLELPHPGIAERSFVLAPISEIAPQWCHPVSGLSAEMMLARLKAETADL